MTKSDPIRIGIIGAGAICRTRHIPGLQKIPGVSVVAVSNRTPESAKKIAGEFNIPETIDKWEDLLARKDIDAVFIGTWPYMHKEMSVAALTAGKHVFCQARMAMNLAEAKVMCFAAKKNPKLVAMICPPPTRMPFEPFVKKLLADGELGTITAVELLAVSGANTNESAIHWRERKEFSGKQIMAMGIYAETLNAWVGPYEELSARTIIAIPQKTDASSGGNKTERIRVPQGVMITGRLANGAIAIEHHLGLAMDKTTPCDRLTIWGLKGTLRYTFGATIEVAKVGEALKAVDVPAELKRDWWAEDEFIAAVRNARAGQPFSVTPDFAEGLLYMQKVEAVHEASGNGKSVKLGEL
jgi:predicted dehydrogenase